MGSETLVLRNVELLSAQDGKGFAGKDIEAGDCSDCNNGNGSKNQGGPLEDPGVMPWNLKEKFAKAVGKDHSGRGANQAGKQSQDAIFHHQQFQDQATTGSD